MVPNHKDIICQHRRGFFVHVENLKPTYVPIFYSVCLFILSCFCKLYACMELSYLIQLQQFAEMLVCSVMVQLVLLSILWAPHLCVENRGTHLRYSGPAAFRRGVFDTRPPRLKVGTLSGEAKRFWLLLFSSYPGVKSSGLTERSAGTSICWILKNPFWISPAPFLFFRCFCFFKNENSYKKQNGLRARKRIFRVDNHFV